LVKVRCRVRRLALACPLWLQVRVKGSLELFSSSARALLTLSSQRESE